MKNLKTCSVLTYSSVQSCAEDSAHSVFLETVNTVACYCMSGTWILQMKSADTLFKCLFLTMGLEGDGKQVEVNMFTKSLYQIFCMSIIQYVC